jgi:LuxR family maltose regulon positive regulatory protein
MVPLVRQAFVAELERRRPERAREIRTAAADWLARSGSRQDALVLRLANGDRDDALTLLSDVVLPMFSSGRLDDLVALIHGIGPEAAHRSGYLATMISYAGVMTGDVVCARRWGVAADEFYRTHRYADATEAAAHLTLRAHIAPAGAYAMRADARRALELVEEGHPWAVPAMMLAGTAAALCGDLAEAAALLTESAHIGRERAIWPAAVLALAERAALADESGDAATAARLIDGARALLVEADLGAYPHAAMVYALAGTIAAREGRRSAAARDLAAADRLLPRIGRALPWLGIQVRVTSARGRLALGDWDDAAELVAQARTLISRFPDAPRLGRDLDALTRALTELATGAGGRGLTPAEMRLLPLLPTRATFEEIGEKLHVSRNTVKTHAVSVYRKLGATSRSEAVERARSLGLLPR